MNFPHFQTYQKEKLLGYTRLRKFETKLGERVQVVSGSTLNAESLSLVQADYVIIGIPENIGVLANLGKAGTDTAWEAFLSSFLNIQSNDFLLGDQIAVLGHFDFSDIENLIQANAGNEEEKLEAYRHALHTVDQEVESLIKLLVAAGKFPIVIGGGHNNAYPLIRGAAKGLQQLQGLPLAQINVINLDAHSDYRPAEGRHSGNGFRYAEDDGYLQKYCIVGLHENYLPQNVWLDIVNNPFMDFITFEDIFIHEKRSFRQAVSHAVEFTRGLPCGIELDLDSIEKTLSSARAASGLETIHARQYINLTAAHANPCYLHIAEGAAEMGEQHDADTGKLISYLVSDFIKMHEI